MEQNTLLNIQADDYHLFQRILFHATHIIQNEFTPN